VHDRGRGEELASLLARCFGELFQQILVGVAQGVVGDRVGVEADAAEAVEKGDEG